MTNRKQLTEYIDTFIDQQGNLTREDGTIIDTVNYSSGLSANLKLADTNKSTRKRISYLLDQAFPENIPGIQIKEFPNYYINEDSRVYSTVLNRFLNPTVNTSGYKVVTLDKKAVYIHRLVAQYYVDGYSPELTVNHKDGNKLNNNPNNLEWITNEENLKHAWETGLQASRNVSCAISKDGQEWMFFSRMIDAKRVIEEELNITMANASKLTKAAKLNDERVMHHTGVPINECPYRYRGYIVVYTVDNGIPTRFRNMGTLSYKGLETKCLIGKDENSMIELPSIKAVKDYIKENTGLSINHSTVVRAAKNNKELGTLKYKSRGYYVVYA